MDGWMDMDGWTLTSGHATDRANQKVQAPDGWRAGDMADVKSCSSTRSGTVKRVSNVAVGQTRVWISYSWGELKVHPLPKFGETRSTRRRRIGTYTPHTSSLECFIMEKKVCRPITGR
ncbi:hypothetical protein FPSE_00500 [Fusarium pseudograminearum CS3096]|uniref:Uncharacterized protein n=1 Tax=Fusarium pseudograminearum (strain CS3096) TaxID=1028729 RepID=K3W3G5_FUSPC|nr:hypothetical protein FPSE_00500 [Fusarium pseudograminearum CS3096]EKJ79360.1 hypothetical protein FPSE_00500 [Fusarium pseudograminearum CS3096]